MKIFISYRRKESAYIAAVISDRLQQHFGPDAVFLDVDNVPLGVDFRDYLGDAVGRCDVLLAIMGDKWADIRDDKGERRIDQSRDHVRVEIESALKRSIPVVPVLVDQATMPDSHTLPETLQPLIYRNAAEVRAGKDLRQHLDRLVAGLDALAKITARTPTDPATPLEGSGVIPQEVPPGLSTGQFSVTQQLILKDYAPGIDDRARVEPTPQRDKRFLLEQIREVLGSFTDSYLHVGSIPTAKLEAAIQTYGADVSAQDVLLLYDNTVWGGAKDGFFLTASSVHWHNMWGSGPRRLRYKEVETITSSQGILSAKLVLNLEEIDLNMGNPKQIVVKMVAIIRHLGRL